MLSKSAILMALLTTALAVGLAAAQENMPGGKWWKMPAVAQRLNLSDQEISQLDESYWQSRRQMIRLKANMETEQLELQSIIEGRDMNEAAALTQYAKLDKARSELGQERFLFFLKVRTIVGHERFNTLMRWREARQNRIKRNADPKPAGSGN